MEASFVIALVVFLVFAIIWLYQFVQLMLLTDSDFPGKYDKILWGAAFFFIFLLAPIAFIFWKKAALSLHAQERKQPQRDAT